MADNEIIIGSSVRPKSGGPNMTVEKFHKDSGVKIANRSYFAKDEILYQPLTFAVLSLVDPEDADN